MKNFKVGDKVKLYQYGLDKNGEVEVQVVYKYLVKREIYSSLDVYREELEFADEKTTRFGTYTIKLHHSKIGTFDFLGSPAKNHFTSPQYVSLENTEETFKEFKKTALYCLKRARLQRIDDHGKLYYNLPSFEEDSVYQDLLKRAENLEACEKAKLVPTREVIPSC